MHRNHSDSSLKGFFAAHGEVEGNNSTDSLPLPQMPPRSASRALSWCATDNSAGSIPKLDTLIEGQTANVFTVTNTLQKNGGGGGGGRGDGSSSGTIYTSNNNLSMISNYNGSTNSLTVPGTPPPTTTRFNNNDNKNTNNNNNNNISNKNISIPPRSASVNSLRRNDAQVGT
jgi:hypothetical protein